MAGELRVPAMCLKLAQAGTNNDENINLIGEQVSIREGATYQTKDAQREGMLFGKRALALHCGSNWDIKCLGDTHQRLPGPREIDAMADKEGWLSGRTQEIRNLSNGNVVARR